MGSMSCPVSLDFPWASAWCLCKRMYRTVPYRTIPYRTIPYRTVPYRTVPYRTVPYRAVPYSTGTGIYTSLLCTKITPYHTVQVLSYTVYSHQQTFRV